MVEYALANGSAASLNYDSNNEVAIADALDFIAKAQTAYHNSNITLTGGLTAKSIDAKFNDASITLTGASLKGHYAITGNPTLSGNPHFTGDVYFYGGVVGDSLSYDSAKIYMQQTSLQADSIKADLSHATVTVTGAEIKGKATISGNNIYTGQVHYNNKIYFHTSETEDDSTTVDGAKLFMQDSTVNAARCSIGGNPTISGNPRYTGNPHFDGNIYLNRTVDGSNKYAKVYADNASIMGNPIFNGTPTFQNGANGLSVSGGGYGHGDTIDLSGTDIDEVNNATAPSGGSIILRGGNNSAYADRDDDEFAIGGKGGTIDMRGGEGMGRRDPDPLRGYVRSFRRGGHQVCGQGFRVIRLVTNMYIEMPKKRHKIHKHCEFCVFTLMCCYGKITLAL